MAVSEALRRPSGSPWNAWSFWDGAARARPDDFETGAGRSFLAAQGAA
jgi:hypothetical protein